jgi:hypothetical protein
MDNFKEAASLNLHRMHIVTDIDTIIDLCEATRYPDSAESTEKSDRFRFE